MSFPTITQRAQLPSNWPGVNNDLPVDTASLINVARNPYGSIVWGLISGIGRTLLQTYLNDRATSKSQAYNDPSAQVQRLQAAGLNPMAALGGIASNNTLAYKAADVDKLSPAEYLQLQNMALQNQNLKEQNKSIQLSNQQKRNLIYYQDETFENKVAQEFYRTNIYRLSAMYKNGEITRQEYENGIRANDASYSDWYNSPNTFTSGIAPRDYITLKNAAYAAARASSAESKAAVDEYYMKMLKEFGVDNTTQVNNPFSLFFTMLKMLMNMDADIPSNYTAPFSK